MTSKYLSKETCFANLFLYKCLQNPTHMKLVNMMLSSKCHNYEPSIL